MLFLLLLVSALENFANSQNYSGCQHVVAGAGISGVYLAHSLMSTGTYSAENICIFEANSRPGGRIYSHRDENGRLMFDLGGFGYYSGGNPPIMDSIKEAFGLHTTCEAYLSNCESGKYYSKMRNQGFVNQMKGTKDSSTIPYFLLSDEENFDKASYVDPYAILEEQLPILEDIGHRLDSHNKTKAWKAVRDIYNYMYDNNVPMTDLKYWETDMRTALYNVTTGERIMFSAEKWDATLNALDEAESDSAEWILHATKYGLFSEDLAGDYGDGDDVVFSDVDGNPIGYSTPLEAMLTNFTESGGRIFYNHKVSAITRPDNHPKKFRVEGIKATYSGNKVFALTAKSVVLNMGIPDLNRLSRSSVMWTETEFDFEQLLKSYGTTVAQKGFLHYNDPWWIRLINQTNNAVTTDEPLKYFENVQTWLDCDLENFGKNDSWCGAWTQVSYINGLQNAAYWDSANIDRTDGPIWLEWDNPVTAPFLEDAHDQFLKIYSKKLKQIGVDPETIALPDRGAFVYWEGGWAYVKTNKFDGRHNRYMRKPLHLEGSPDVEGDELCIINTDVSAIPGEAEGALLSAVEALKLCYDVQMPNLPQAFYNYVVDSVF